MHLAVNVVALLALAAAAAGFANRVGLSAPLFLTALGLILSFVPGMPTLPLEPEIVLIGILPPLLYATAIRTPWVDISRNRRPIALLSVGLVVVTALAVALVVTWIMPQVPFAVALALGAVVAPPDAVAASAVARRVRMPRKVVSLLEGESLLNDATALVTLRTAIVAVTATGGVIVRAGAGGGGIAAVALGVDVDAVEPGRSALHLDVDAEAVPYRHELGAPREVAAAARLDDRRRGRTRGLIDGAGDGLHRARLG